MIRRTAALLLGAAASMSASAADATADDALRVWAMADGQRLTQASWCGYAEDALERLTAQLRARTDARVRERGGSLDEQGYSDGFYAGMQRAMSELLALPADETADEHRYRARHCAQLRSEIDALLGASR